MSINIDPNAAHAVYAPSSAPRWAMKDGCSASAEAISARGYVVPDEEGEEAAEGTAAHDEIDRILGQFNGQIVEPEQIREAAKRMLDVDHPAAFGVALTLDYAAKLPRGRLWVEQRVALTSQIWGRCDIAHWHEESFTLTIIDYKNGYVGVDAVENEQTRIYGAGSIYTHNLAARWIRYAIVQPNDFRPVPRVKQWGEPVESLFAFAQRVAAIPGGPKRFVAGEQCTYCPLFGKCPATQDLLRQLVALVAGLMTPDQVKPDQWVLFLACKKPIADAFKGAESWLTKGTLKTKLPPPGMKLVVGDKKRVWLNEAAARAKIIETKSASVLTDDERAKIARGEFDSLPGSKVAAYFSAGIEALDLPSPAQAEEMGIDITGLADKPKGGPVIAFENDKRPDWKPIDATEMFAGVAAKLAKS